MAKDEETGVAEGDYFPACISHQRSQRRSTAERLSTEERAGVRVGESGPWESTGDESSHIYVHETGREIVSDLLDLRGYNTCRGSLYLQEGYPGR